MDGFAVIPDGAVLPAAVFVELEDAIDWAVDRFGNDRFAIKNWNYALAEGAHPVVGSALN